MTLATQTLTLQAFLTLPNLEESPAWEFVNGHPQQKPMPTLHHSRLQKRLISVIDQANSEYEAFPELRCILSENSVVPDIAIVHQSRIPTVNTPIQGAPNWLIEILSPDQSTTKLIAKIESCLREGSYLGWLVDSVEQVVMVFEPERRFAIARGDMLLPTLANIDVSLTPSQIFAWLVQKS